jgi:hypothetical protein
MPNEFKVKNGLIVDQGGATITGSLNVSGSDATINSVRVGIGGGQQVTNIVLGANSLMNNTTGTANIAIGYFTSTNNTIGSDNTAIGNAALTSNLSGGYNTAVGRNAGRYIADGATAITVTSQSVFLGGLTKALADSQTNQIVIGYNAIGLGSNSAVLGNDSITRTALKGSVSIGTTGSISSTLHIRGSGTTSATTALRVENTNASASLVVLDNGNVGVGTTTPSQTLTVNGNISASGNLFINTGSNQIRIGDNLNDNVSADTFKLYNVGINGFLGTYFYNSSLELKAGASGSSFVSNWSKIEIKDNFSSPGYIRFFTSGSERARITNAGNFGIGTTSPSSTLDVSGSGRFTNGLTVTGSLIAPSITGSLQGTASFATTASYALTSSAAGANTTVQYNSNGNLFGSNRFTFDGTIVRINGGTLLITGSSIVSGSSIITGSLQVGIPGTSAATIDTTVGTLGRGDIVSVDWPNRQLQDSTPVLSIDWEGRTLTDSVGNPSIDWTNRTLSEATATFTALDYSNDGYLNSQLYYRNIIPGQVQRKLAETPASYYGGQVIQATVDAGVTDFQLVFLDTDGTWKATKATVANGASKMLGICVDQANGYVLIDGDIGVSDDNSQGAYVIGADHGLPAYVSATTGVMTTTTPSSTGELVRIVGHIYYQSTTDANWWTMKFRPSNDWYVI